MKNLIVTGIQVLIEPNNTMDNVSIVCDWMIRVIQEYEADLIVFPEAVTTGFNPGLSVEEIWELLPVSVETLLKPVQSIAREYKRHCVFPTYERGSKQGIVYNSAYLIDDRGLIVGVYRKTHLYPVENRSSGGWVTPGNNISVFETRLGRIGLMLSYDGDFPEVARVMKAKGADFLVRPSAYLNTYALWEITNLARSYENNIPIIGVNAIGPDGNDHYYFGHSMVIVPQANKTALARSCEDVIYSRLSCPNQRYEKDCVVAEPYTDNFVNRNLKSYGEYLTHVF